MVCPARAEAGFLSKCGPTTPRARGANEDRRCFSRTDPTFLRRPGGIKRHPGRRQGASIGIRTAARRARDDASGDPWPKSSAYPSLAPLFRQLHSDFEAAGRLSSRRVAPRDARGACAGAAVVAGGGRPWASSDSVWALAEARNEQRSVVFFAPWRRFVTGVARGTRSRNARRTRAAEPRAGCARGGSRPWSASNWSSDDFSSAIGSRAGNANDLDAAHAGVFDEILCFSLVPAFE